MTRHSSAITREDAPHVNQTNEDDSTREKIEALAEIICGAGDESAGALFVLMGTLENSTHPKVLAHTVKHFAFTRCGELNLFGMVDAQIAAIESELLTSNCGARQFLYFFSKACGPPLAERICTSGERNSL